MCCIGGCTAQFISQQQMVLEEKKRQYESYFRPDSSNGHRWNKIHNSLPQINRALSAIKNGTYGICESCGEYIPQERLRAVPGATRCIECQENWRYQWTR